MCFECHLINILACIIDGICGLNDKFNVYHRYTWHEILRKIWTKNKVV